MESLVFPSLGPLIAELGVGMAMVVLFAIYVMRVWRDGKTTERAQTHLQHALEFAERREAALTERVTMLNAQIEEVLGKLIDAEHDREQDRMLWETKLEANEMQLEETAAQLRSTQLKLDEALARLADAERQRDAIAEKAHAEKQEFEATIQELRAEVEQLRQLVSQFQD